MSEIDVTPLGIGAQDRALLHEALDTALNALDARGLYISFTTFHEDDTRSCGLILGRVNPVDIVDASVRGCQRVLEKMAVYRAGLARGPRQ